MPRFIAGLLLPLLAALALLFLVAPAEAQTTITVTANPAKFQVSATAPTTVSVVWQITRVSPPVPGTSSSPNAQIIVGGTPVATVGAPLSRTFPGVSFTEVAFLSETVVIPQSAVFRAVKSGAPIVLARTFNDTEGVSDTGAATLAPTGPGSEAFSVSRLDLRFEDQSRVKVLPKNVRLRAIAELSTTGRGLVEAEWQIAPAVTTPGTPVFQTLALVRQPVAFGGRLVITSPPLPTRFEGTNLVRLRITDPRTRFDAPELTYYVTPESPQADQQSPRLLLTTAPAPGTPLTLTTRFAWQAVPGAQVYKLQVFPAPPGPDDAPSGTQVTTPVPLDPAPDTTQLAGLQPLTGAVVPGTQTEIRLQDYSLAHLPGDRRYLWTVTALDAEGARLGVSPPREIYKP